jgi:hypothetical protein
MCIKINKICTFFVTFFSATIDGRDLIFGHKLHIGTPYCGKRFWTHQIPTSCLPTWYDTPALRQTGSRNLTGQKTLPTIWGTYIKLVTKYQISAINSCGHKLHIGTPYCGKRFWTHQIPTSCLPTWLIFIHIEHTFCICPFLVAFFSATIDGRNLIFGHKLYIGTPYKMMMVFALNLTNMLSWIFIVLAYWNNSIQVDMSFYWHTLSWFRGKQYCRYALSSYQNFTWYSWKIAYLVLNSNYC